VNKKREPRVDKEKPLTKRLLPCVRHLAPKTSSDYAGGLQGEVLLVFLTSCRGRYAVAVQRSMPAQLQPSLLRCDCLFVGRLLRPTCT
jgi:hypothetical protein